MVFPSIRLYLDPPNWQHQDPNQHLLQANGSTNEQNSAHHMLPPLPPQAQDPQVGSIMAGSMADRAQIAKIPPPEATLKCPRCESTNTKFCYFNNYSLSQPRHFCKTCRRYWTRGGALRNVPVGGGCRRSKKSKKGQGRSKSPASAAAPSSTTEKHSLPIHHNSVPSSATCQELIGRFSSQQPRGFMASLQNISRYGSPVGNMGQNELMGFQIGGGGVEPWRLSGFESSNGNNNNCAASYPSFHQGGGLVGLGDHHQMAPPVKVELGGGNNNNNNNNNLNLMMSGSESNQYYSWTDHLSGLASSSAHLL